ncbi:MAG: hypothetical protein JXA10_20235, partial [Anaerolineae bacterium]|nr:hypothetical protein [Anaerolineae bacterium]
YKIFNNARTATVSLPINPVKSTPIPALVSANVLAVLNTGSRDPAVGDTGTLEMRLPLGTTQLEFEIVGILDQFDGLAADTRFIVAPITYLLPAVNARNALDQHYAPNTLYLHLADQEPSAALRDALKPYHARYAWDIQHTLEQQSFRKVAIELLIRGFGLMLFVTTLAFVINKVGTSP